METRPSLEIRQNLVAGRPAAAAAGARFEVARGAGGTWPRSCERDVRAALDALDASSWSQQASNWRAPAAPRLPPLAITALGLAQDEVPLPRELPPPPFPPPAPGAGVTLMQFAWCDPRLHRSVAGELAAGRAVLLLSDGPLPAIAEGVARHLLGAGIAPRALALVHDDGDTALRAACADPRVDRVLLTCSEARRAERLAWATGLAGRSGFGAGVRELAAPDVHVDGLRPCTARVLAGEDPQARAVEIAEAAFGRATALSGQAFGQVGRVLVHPHQLSRFTAALLSTLEAQALVDPPLVPLERSLVHDLEQVRGQGLDEGATLIHEVTHGSRRASSGGRIARLVFTNVEPHMRLWGLARPLPVLLLSRLTDGDPE